MRLAVFWTLQRLAAAVLTCGCAGPRSAPPGAAAPVSLASRWMIGIEPMRYDAPLQMPYSNRLLADIAAMPNTQVVALSSARNAWDFDAWIGNKIRVETRMRDQGWCMTINYTVMMAGQQSQVYGLVVPEPQFGVQTDPLCVDQAATALYANMARQGL